MNTTNPIAYAVYGINAAGKHYLREVKRVDPADTAGDWKLDDDGLDDRWAGNEPLGVITTNPSASELTDERALFIACQRQRDNVPDYIDDATIMAGGIVQHEYRGWQDRAAIARQAAPEATPSVRKISEQLHAAISRYCPDAQARIALMSAVGRIVDSILPASTGAAPEAPASEQQAIPPCPHCEKHALEPGHKDGSVQHYQCGECMNHSHSATTASASIDALLEAHAAAAIAAHEHGEQSGYYHDLRSAEQAIRDAICAAAPSRDAAPLNDPQLAAYLRNEPWISAYIETLECELRKAQAPHAGAALDASQAEVARLTALLNTPETLDFMKGLQLEAAHQRERWSTSHDGGKAPADWFWLIGYLAQKAMMAQITGNTDKALHHTISTAAALANWHAAILGNNNMRPGIEPPPDAAMSAAKQGEQ